jgi:hypothetical protein
VVPPLLPGGFDDFVRLVVPELQRRGIFRTEYEEGFFRDRLGLKRPANPHSTRARPQAASGAATGVPAFASGR